MSRLRFRMWPGLIFVLLGLNFCVVGATVYFAHASATPVEPDYYQRALNWDQEHRIRLAGRSLGWKMEAWFVRAGEQTVQMEFRLLDSRDQPIRSARISAECFHEAQPTNVVSLGVVEGPPGEYRAALRTADAQRGLWRMTALARASGCDFLSEQQIELTGSNIGDKGREVPEGR